jgi:hypothetical protein
MIKTATVAVNADANGDSPGTIIQSANVAIAIDSTAGTKIAEMRSASR